jgi:hypothetical protein
MSTTTTTPQAATTNKAAKLFTSRNFEYALKQAEKNGFRALPQGMSGITSETAVEVKTWKPAAKELFNPSNERVLGYMTYTQTRTIEADMRTEAEKLAGAKHGVLRYNRVLLAQEEVTELVIAQMLPGTAIDKAYYIAEVVTFVPVYPNQYGVVTAGQLVKRYSSKFLCRIDRANPERKADRLLLNAGQNEAFNKANKKGLLDYVRQEQLESGLLTQGEIDAAIARDKNNKPTPTENVVLDEATGKHVDAATGEVVEQGIRSTSFGGAMQPSDDDNDMPF